MNKYDRTMSQRLQAIIERHEAREQRTMLELRQAGFGNLTIAQARERLAAQRRFPTFSQDQLNEILDALQEERMGRRKAS